MVVCIAEMNTFHKSATDKLLSAEKYSCLNDIAVPQLDKDYNLQSFFPSVGTASVGFPGGATFDLHALNTVTGDEASGCSKPLPVPYSFPGAHEAVCCSQFIWDYSSGVQANHVDACISSDKRFLIFDQSGDKTSLFFSPFNPQGKTSSSVAAAAGASFLCEDVAALVNPQPNHETWDENDLAEEESKMEEDAEEINALLYSDSDESSDEDEVTSKEHFPLITESGCHQYVSFQDFRGEAGIPDRLLKRRRLLDGSCTDTRRSPMNLDASSSCGDAYVHDDDINPTHAGKRIKIEQALKLLQTIVPDLNTQDPLFIINKAIVYLKSMKAQVEALRLKSTTATTYA